MYICMPVCMCTCMPTCMRVRVCLCAGPCFFWRVVLRMFQDGPWGPLCGRRRATLDCPRGCAALSAWWLGGGDQGGVGLWLLLHVWDFVYSVFILSIDFAFDISSRSFYVSCSIFAQCVHISFFYCVVFLRLTSFPVDLIFMHWKIWIKKYFFDSNDLTPNIFYWFHNVNKKGSKLHDFTCCFENSSRYVCMYIELLSHHHWPTLRFRAAVR